MLKFELLLDPKYQFDGLSLNNLEFIQSEDA